MLKKLHPDFGEVKFKARVLEMKSGEKVAFAFGLDPKGAEHVLLFHHKKSGKPLFKIVQENKEHVGKGTWGFANLDGKVLVLDCAKRVDGLKKALKLWVKDRKHPMIKKGRVLVGGHDIIEEGEDDEKDEEETLEASGQPGADDEAVATPAPPPPTAKQLTATLGKLLPLVNKASQAAPARKEELITLVKEAQASIQAQEFEQAKELVLTVGRRAKEIAAGSAAQAKLEWLQAKRTVEANLDALQRTIAREFGDTDAAGAAATLFRALKRFDKGLSDTLEALEKSGEADRGSLRASASATVDGYLDYVQSDPLVDHIANNPFGIATDLKSTLVAPLTRLKAQLGA